MQVLRVAYVFTMISMTLASAAPTSQVFQLTNGPNPDFLPAVDGTTYVWQRGTSSNTRIMMWSEGDATPVQISERTREFRPRMDGGRVVWYSNAVGGDFEVKLWEDGLETTLTSNSDNDHFCDIGGTATVWLFNTWFLRYDNGQEQLEITADTGEVDRYPSVMNDWLTWEAGSPKNIYFWNDGDLSQLTDTAYSNVRPETDGSTIVWYTSGEPGDLSNVMRWTEALGTVALTNDGVSLDPDVSGDVVAFSRFDGNDYEVYFRYLGVDYQITDNDFDDLEPAVSGDRVVWGTRDGSDRFIYYAVLSGLDGGEVAGACCVDLECISTTPTSCSSQSGTFLGAESLCTVDSCGIEPAAGWSTFQHDAQRTGRTDAVIPELPVRIWSLFIGQSTQAISPTIGPDETIYVIGNGNSTLAVRPDGNLKWHRLFSEGQVFAPATIRQDGNFYLPRQDRLAKVSVDDGATLCSVVGSSSFAAALDSTGDCYFTHGPTSVRRMQPDCSVEWTFNATNTITSHVALGLDGGVHVSSDFWHAKLNPSDGSEAWRIATSGRTGAPAIAPDGTIHFYNKPNVLYAMNPDGTEKWTVALPGLNEAQSAPSPAIGLDGTIYQPSKTTTVSTQALVAVSAAGSELWRVTTPGFDSLSPVIDGIGTVLLPVLGGDMLALSAVDGSELWRISQDGGDYVNAPPAIAEDGTIYVVTEDGWLIAYGAGCPEISSPEPPFSYREVVAIDDRIGGIRIDEIVEFELDNAGRVTFRATTGNNSTSFTERADGGFDVITQGTMIDGFEIDSASLPRKDDQGNVYLFAQVVDVGPAVFVNDELYVATRESADPPVLLDSFSSSGYVDHDESGRFLVLGRRISSVADTLFSIDSATAAVTELLNDSEVIDGFILGDLRPNSVDGYANDGVPVLQADNGQVAIVTPTSVIVRTGDVIDGRPIGHVRTPRRNSGGMIYYLGTGVSHRDIFSHTPDGVDSFERGFGDRIAQHPVLQIETYSINEQNDIGYHATLLGTRGIFLNDEPVAVLNITEIDGSLVESGISTNHPVSLNDERQIAFVANDALYVATLLIFDFDHDGDVDGDDLDQVEDCFASGEDPGCSCLDKADSNRDSVVDCVDWEELKRTWTGPPTFPPFRPECDVDCNGNDLADELETGFGVTPDCDGNLRPDSCDLADDASLDCDGNAAIDSCEIVADINLDCNGNSRLDSCDLFEDPSLDCDASGAIDECEIALDSTLDCNGNSRLDACDLTEDASLDCDFNGDLDICEIAADITLDCNGNSRLDSCDLADDAGFDCDGNGGFDACEIAADNSLDCNGNSRLDSCDLTDDPGIDLDGDGMIDSCCRPVQLFADSRGPKNRFLSFETSEQGMQAVRILLEDLPPPFEVFNGKQMWVGPTSEVSEVGAQVIPSGGPTFTAARLQCAPAYSDLSSLGTIHVFHEAIVPNGTYALQVINEGCGIAIENNYSDALPMTTATWGDTVLDLSETPPLPANGPPVDIVDALGILGAFSNALGAIIKARADLEPNCLDLRINVTDVLASLAGFSGLSYPFVPKSTDPCDSPCPNPLP